MIVQSSPHHSSRDGQKPGAMDGKNRKLSNYEPADRHGLAHARDA